MDDNLNFLDPPTEQEKSDEPVLLILRTLLEVARIPTGYLLSERTHGRLRKILSAANRCQGTEYSHFLRKDSSSFFLGMFRELRAEYQPVQHSKHVHPFDHLVQSLLISVSLDMAILGEAITIEEIDKKNSPSPTFRKMFNRKLIREVRSNSYALFLQFPIPSFRRAGVDIDAVAPSVCMICSEAIRPEFGYAVYENCNHASCLHCEIGLYRKRDEQTNTTPPWNCFSCTAIGPVRVLYLQQTCSLSDAMCLHKMLRLIERCFINSSLMDSATRYYPFLSNFTVSISEDILNEKLTYTDYMKINWQFLKKLVDTIVCRVRDMAKEGNTVKNPGFW